MRKCKEFQDMISCAIDGMLDADAMRTLSHHLEQCPDCRRVYAQMQQASAAFQQSEAEVPAALLDGVMQRIGSAASEANQQKKKPYVRYLSAAACLALVLFIGYAALHSGFSASKDTAAPESNTVSDRYTGGGESIGLYDDFADFGAVMKPTSPEFSPNEVYEESDSNIETTDRGFATTDQSEAHSLIIELDDKIFTYSGHTDTTPDFGGETLSYEALILPENLNVDLRRDPLLCGETLLIPDADSGWFTFSQN